MPRVVLVVLSRPAAARACLDAATHAISILGGTRIVAMAMRVDPATTILPSEEVLTVERRAEIERQSNSVIGALRASFTEWQSTSAIDAEWVEAEGAIEIEIAQHGQTVELVVTAAAAGPQDKTGTALHAALLTTHRPVLVVPDTVGATLGRHVAIAWHDDEPATRAALSAMPFLAAAERVSLLRGGRGGDKTPEIPTLFSGHRIAVEPHLVAAGRRDIGQALLAEAHAIGADLLVMGAYAHRPLVEAVLGGVTRTMLHAADIPLFMQH
jgi:nucleotide-binding universal stress UspA family protein